MGNLYAIRGAFLQQWRSSVRFLSTLSFMIYSIQITVIVAWVATQSGDPAILAYIALGAPLMVVWDSYIFWSGTVLSWDIFAGTIEASLVSRTSLSMVMLGKALAVMTFCLLGGAVGFVVFFAIADYLPHVANPGALAVSLILSVIGLLCAGFFFSPFIVLLGGRPGMLLGILPFGLVLSGFLHPVTILPSGVEVIARLLPTSWAMEAVVGSVNPGASMRGIAEDWGMTALLSLVYLGLTYGMFVIVERRVRVTAILSTG